MKRREFLQLLGIGALSPLLHRFASEEPIPPPPSEPEWEVVKIPGHAQVHGIESPGDFGTVFVYMKDGSVLKTENFIDTYPVWEEVFPEDAIPLAAIHTDENHQSVVDLRAFWFD